MKFRKKPIMIEASRWFKNGDHPKDGNETFIHTKSGETPRCEGKIVRYFRDPNISGYFICRNCGHSMHEHGWVDTMEGGHIVCPGDWIITGIKGEIYPCKPDIFEAAYEKVEECGHEYVICKKDNDLPASWIRGVESINVMGKCKKCGTVIPLNSEGETECEHEWRYLPRKIIPLYKCTKCGRQK